MSLHRLLSMRVGVPRPEELAGFYREIGLTTDESGRVASPDGGTQVVIEETPFRQLLGVEVGVSDERDLDEISARFDGLGITTAGSGTGTLQAVDPTSRVRVSVSVAAPMVQVAADLPSNPSSMVRHLGGCSGRATGSVRARWRTPPRAVDRCRRRVLPG